MIDPIFAVIIVLVFVAALGFGGTMLTDRANKRDMHQIDADRREERAHQERLEQERQARFEQERKEEAGAMEGARRRMAFAQESIHQAKQAFQQKHDQLIGDIHQRAKAGCDAEFEQRFGITRVPKAPNPADDAEVQEYLMAHYAELRDVALAGVIEEMVQEEADRRVASLQEAAEQEALEQEALEQECAEASEEADPTIEESEGESPENGTVSVDEPESADVASEDDEPAISEEALEEAPDEEPGEAPDAEDGEVHEPDSKEVPVPGPAPEPDRALIEKAVREEFDLTSIRTYLLAAISARYDADGKPIGDLPWPAYTSISSRGYGELVLSEGSPVYAQDAYREFAWKRFHTGRRAEKPLRGEYSWPASHELGDGLRVESVPTPAGVFTAQGPDGALPLYELLDCTWMRHSLEYQGALLEPDGQRSFFVNLEGLRKGDMLQLRFDSADFLEEAEDGPFFLNAMGEVNGAYVGISASKPEAANLGEAPYELAERTPSSLVFRMTHDARRHDVDTYPQFLEVHVAWCQQPSPRPERIVRHVTN